MSELFDRLGGAISSDSLLTYLSTGSQGSDRSASSLLASKQVVDHLAMELPRHIPSDVPWTLAHLSVKYSILVRNQGSRQLTNVKLTLPSGTQCAKISREDGTRTTAGPSQVLSLGDIQPAEPVRVTAWTLSPAPESSVEDIRVTHTDGIGKVTILRPAGPLAAGIERQWKLSIAIWVLSVIVAAYLYSLISARLAARGETRKQQLLLVEEDRREKDADT